MTLENINVSSIETQTNAAFDDTNTTTTATQINQTQNNIPNQNSTEASSIINNNVEQADKVVSEMLDKTVNEVKEKLEVNEIKQENVSYQEKNTINNQSKELTFTNFLGDAITAETINVMQEELAEDDAAKLLQLNMLDKLFGLYEKAGDDQSLKMDVQKQMVELMKTIDQSFAEPKEKVDSNKVQADSLDSSNSAKTDDVKPKSEFRSVMPGVLFVLHEKLDSITSGHAECDEVKKVLSEIPNDNKDHSDVLIALLEDIDLRYKNNEISNDNYSICKSLISNAADNFITTDKPSTFFAELKDTPYFQNIVNDAQSVMTEMHLGVPKSIRMGIKDLFVSFCNGNPELKNLSETDRKMMFAEVLSSIAQHNSTYEVCNAVDNLLRGCAQYNVLGESLKTAFTSKNYYSDVISQHQFSCALKALVESLPKEDAAKLTQKNYITSSMLDKFSRLSSSPKFNYQLANVIVLQDHLIRKGMINVENFVDNTKMGDAEQQLNPSDIADEILKKFVDKIGLDDYIKNNVFIENMTESSAGDNDEFVNIDFNIKDLNHEKILNSVKEMSENFSVRNLRGKVDANKVASTIQNTANSLTGTKFSNDYLTRMFDDVSTRSKGMHVFDGVVMQLTGKIDYKDRGVIGEKDVQNRSSSTLDLISNDIKQSVQKSLDERIAKLEGKDKDGVLSSMILSDPTSGKDLNNMKIMPTVKDMLVKMDEKTVSNLEKNTGVLKNLKNIRTKFVSNLKQVKDFSVKNNECLKIHEQKKELHSEYKTQKKWYEKLTWVTAFSFKKRMKNAKMIAEFGKVSKDIETLINTISHQNEKLQEYTNGNNTDAIKTTNEALNQLTKNLEQLYKTQYDLREQIKFINLKDLTGTTKHELTDDELLSEAVPLAKALIYFKNGEAKQDLVKIKGFKAERNQLRKELNEIRKEVKQVYGEETIRQVERAIVTAAYIRGLETEDGEVNAFSKEGRARIDEILTKNFGISNSGFMKVFVDDTIRRYTDPKGNLTSKYLSLIEQKMVNKNETSIVKEQRKADKSLFSNHVNQATAAYINQSTSELFEVISKPGQSFVYNKDSGVKLNTAPGILSVSTGYLWDNSLKIENTGSGYDVFIKSDKALELAVAAGYVLTPSVKLAAEAAVKAGVGTGVKLHFDDLKNANTFLQDFMNKDSAIHHPEKFKNEKPSWNCADNVQFMQERKIEGGISASVNVGMSIFNEDSKYNSFSIGKDYNAKITLPNAKAKVSFSGSSDTVKYTNGKTTIEKSKSGWKVELDASVEQAKVSGVYNPYYNKRNELIRGALDKLAELTPIKYLLKEVVIPEGEKLGLAVANVLSDTDEGAKALKILIADIQKLDKQDAPITAYYDPIMYAFTHDKLYRKIVNDFIKEESSNNIQKAAKLLVNAMNEYSKKTSYVFKLGGAQTNSDGKEINPGISINVDIPLASTLKDYAGRGVNQLRGKNDNDVKDADDPSNNDSITVSNIKSAGNTALNALSRAAKLTSAVNSLLVDSPLDSVSSLLDGKKLESEVKGKLGTSKATIGGSEILSGSVQGRGKYVQGGASGSLTKGVSANLSIGSMVTTETQKAYDNELKQYTPDNMITYSVQKGQFSLDNAINILRLPDSFIDQLLIDPKKFAQINKIFNSAASSDTITVETRITQKALDMVNSLHMSETGKSEKEVKAIQKQINEILADRNNYVPVNLEVNIAEKKDLKLRYELSDFNIGLASYSHHRSFDTVDKYAFSFKSDIEAYKKPAKLSVNEKTVSTTSSQGTKSNVSINSKRQNNANVVGQPATQAQIDNLKADILSDQILPQTIGANTCFIMSIVNSLRHTNEGKQHLANMITQNGTIKLYDGVLNRQVVRKEIPIIATNKGSVLESTIAKAYVDKGTDRHYQYLRSYGEAGNVAELFGLDLIVGNNNYTYSNATTNNQLNNMFNDIRSKLNAGKMVICSSGLDPLQTHYTAVVDTKEINGRKYITVKDSLNTTGTKDIPLDVDPNTASVYHFEFYSLPQNP